MTKLVAANTYTDAELLALYREAVAEITATGQAYEKDGFSFTAADLDDLWNTIERLESRINGSKSGMSFANVRLKRAT